MSSGPDGRPMFATKHPREAAVMRLTFLFAVNALLLLVACGGAVVPLGEVDQGVEGAEDAIPKCEPPSGPVHAYTSASDLEARVSGTWFLCSGAMSGPADSAGIEIGS